MARTPIVVDRPMFETAVKNAEAKGALANLGLLFVAIVKHYTILTIDNNELKPISVAIAKDRLSTWQIEVLTEPGRKPKENLFAARLAEITAAVQMIKELVPAEMADLLGLFDELVLIVNEPLEAAVSTVPAMETVETTEETVEPIEPPVEMTAEETAKKTEFLKLLNASNELLAA